MNFIYVHKDDLRRWQNETLKIQQAFQCLMDKFAIDNWCGGGLLIGAIREGGFLYWDNDIDVFIKHKNLKGILYALWKEGFLAKYEIWSQVDGYWQINRLLNKLLKSKSFDEKSIDTELKNFSKGMFKIFSIKPLAIKLYTQDFNDPETFVRVKQFTKTNLTKFRDDHKNEGIKNGQCYQVLANLCILPMIKVTKCQYIFSSLTILISQAFINLYSSIRKIKNILNHISKNEILYDDKGNDFLIVSELDKQPKDVIFGKIKIALKILSQLFLFLFQKPSTNNKSQKFWTYKPVYFRIIVLPFRDEDLFPTQKVRIENCMINVPNNYENILKVQFGNYFKRPAVHDRVALPFFIDKDR